MPRSTHRGAKGQGAAARREARRAAARERGREAAQQALRAAGAARPDGPVPYLLAAEAGAGGGAPRGTRVPAPALTGWLRGGREPTAAERALLDGATVDARLLDGEGRLTPLGEEWLLQWQRRAPALAASRRRAEEADEIGPLSDQAQAVGDEAQRARMYRAAGDWARQLAAGSGISRRTDGTEYARVPAAGAVDEDEQGERRDLMLAAKHRRGRLMAGGTIFTPAPGLTVAQAVEEGRVLEAARRAARRGAAGAPGRTGIRALVWGLAAGAAVACIAFAMHP